MVKATHEASHRLFHDHPEALAPVFEALGLPPPSKGDFDELSPDATEIRPMERRVDTVLRFAPDMGENFVLALESQTKKDPDKARSWAYYVAYLCAKYDLPVVLVAVCRDRATAQWATGPFELVEVGLESTPTRENWRKLMQNAVTHFPGHRTLFEEKYLEGKAEGEARGEAKGVLRVLEVRGLVITDAVRERIVTCSDLTLLHDWLDRAGTVERAEDLFTPGTIATELPKN
ncbi:hypothetical protein G3I32_21865 [Streptomyces coelicoflavus]|uniref:Rpn family recombination-promoting nuclease/putative transposase n=1 Tax=Streptomyces coelicoflavus TaxID=285562 RepID=A0A7K3PNC5_9ACTN|nr:hypothetical protein [Streptomyces coelicoflavus]NEB11456.1 hypothetical protein [Streptomyces coelicoflavus]